MHTDCTLSENEVKRIEQDIKDVEDSIRVIQTEISGNKEKYMPAVALINELKITLNKLNADFHNATVNMSKSISTAQSSTDSAHKRLDKANEIVDKLTDLPNTLRNDFYKFISVMATVIIGFGIWTENNVNANRLSIELNKQSITLFQEAMMDNYTSIKKAIDKNSLDISKTYQTIKIQKYFKAK